MLHRIRRKSSNGGHSANIKERPVETKRTAKHNVSTIAAPAGYPGYTDGSASPLPVGWQAEQVGMARVSDVAIPLEFGGSWETFVDDWCLGGVLGRSIDEASRALSALKRLWPEEVERLASESSRGLAIVASAVELGLLLDISEPAKGFSDVLTRLVSGERSAYSELVLVAVLRRLGYEPQFAAPIDGRVLDAACDIGGRAVYFEVVAPERSDSSTEDQLRIEELTTQVRSSNFKCRVEIELLRPLPTTDLDVIAAAVQWAPPSEWSLVPSLARVRRIDSGQSLLPLFDGDGAQIAVGGEHSTQSESTSVIVRLEASDVRAKRVFNDEYHHFSERVANVLVVNVCAVSDGMKSWPGEVARLLQPTRNRKVGAVVLFDQGSLGPPEAVRRRWRVVVNPYAHIPVPDCLLMGIESVDESEAHGLQRQERIIAS